jgi:F-type H+-transporting ATPase subunit b
MSARKALLVSGLMLATPSAALAAAGGEPSVLPTPAEAFIPALFTLLVFGGLVIILGKTAWKPVNEGLARREDKIRGDVEAAEAARAEAEKARDDYRREMAGAEQRVRDLMAQAQADGQQLATRIKMQAQEDAEEIKERANREIEQTREAAVEQVRREAGELAVMVAEKILRRDITSDDQQRLVDASLDELERSDVKNEAVPA